MISAESVVREFAENTKKIAIETAKKHGIVLDDAFYAQIRALNQAMAAIVAEEHGESLEIDEQTAEMGEKFAATYGEEHRHVIWLFIGCQAGFNLLEEGQYLAALEACGLVRAVAGYAKKDDLAKFSAWGRAGLDKRHEPVRKLKDWTIKKYSAGTWKSVRHFAKTVEIDVLEEAKRLNAKISDYSARETVANWIYEFKKSRPSP